MRKLFVFNLVTVDGYYEGENHDISWHTVDDEFNEFSIEQLKSIGTLLFGKTTYQLMESYWPTPDGVKDDPAVAHLMNEIPKVVVSTTLQKVTETDTWKNITLIKENVAEEVKKLKTQEGKDIAIFGSGKLMQSLMNANLIDEYRLIVVSVVLGKGTPLFGNITDKHDLTLVTTKQFNNGNVLLSYVPSK